MKRILLLVLTNVLIVVVLGIVASLLGVNRYLTSNGLNLGLLLGYALLIGFGGAFISLLISKPMAKWSSGVQVIAQPQNADEAWIVETVRKFSEKAGIGMPEVGIFEGEPNAFATGAFKDSALVAVSTGLLAFIGAWNEFMFALTFVVNDTERTVPVAISLIAGATAFEIPWGTIMAGSVIVTVPLLLLVFFFQKRIVSGLTAGAVKG